MRLDKYLADSTTLTRSQARKAIMAGDVTIGGEVQTNAASHVDPSVTVCWQGRPVSPPKARYLMLHKPAGYVCSNTEDTWPPVTDLLPAGLREGLIIAGRLDQDTTGMVILGDDGQWTHRLTRPGSTIGKRYRVTLAEPLVADAESRCRDGILLQGENKPTRPAELTRISDTEVLLTLHEGRYHQVKRMMAALGNKVVGLHRESVGQLVLGDLPEGQWRELTAEEIASIK
ncbi:MAG: rRNA pseudouridine synthase [Gammaproteobacteria bacterium]|nr:MAG: rRNA pseudouridine synthase [Gammaproteobacteria bacterium]